MLIQELKKHKLVIVGQHFYWRNSFHQRIAANIFSNADQIEALFIQNKLPEDYESLKNHPDPVVRRLVVMNMEYLEDLSKDTDVDVALLAQEFLRCQPRVVYL